jgi:hypothetical protein
LKPEPHSRGHGRRVSPVLPAGGRGAHIDGLSFIGLFGGYPVDGSANPVHRAHSAHT